MSSHEAGKSGVEQTPAQPLEHAPPGEVGGHRRGGNGRSLVGDRLAVRRLHVDFGTRSAITNQPTASSTVRPTVRDPWLRRMQNFASPIAAAMRLPPSTESTSTSSSSNNAWSKTNAVDSWLSARNGSTLADHGRAERGVGVTGTDDVGSRRQQRCVDVVAGRVDGSRWIAICVHNVAARTDEHEPIWRRRTERHTPVEQPEVIGEDWVAGRDVAVAELAPTLRAEDPIPQGAHFFAMGAFVLG